MSVDNCPGDSRFHRIAQKGERISLMLVADHGLQLRERRELSTDTPTRPGWNLRDCDAWCS